MNAVTDKELDAFYGLQADYSSAGLQALECIRLIPEHLFTPDVAKSLVAAISSRIADGHWSHVQSKTLDAVAAVEHLDDAFDLLEGV